MNLLNALQGVFQSPALSAAAWGMAASFALCVLLFVFVRQALRNASQDEESAQKMAALKASWRKALGK